MRHFDYVGGEMVAEGVPLCEIAASVGTPCYVYSTATLERHYRVFSEAFSDVPALVAFAVKANSNLAVLATLARMGAGADVVSAGELMRALTAGIPANRIVFSGVGKTRQDMPTQPIREGQTGSQQQDPAELVGPQQGCKRNANPGEQGQPHRHCQNDLSIHRSNAHGP